MDPPSAERADALSRFLHEQSASPHPEKLRFAAWKLRENEFRPGFASVMLAEPDDRIVSACTVTPKRLWSQGEQSAWGEIGDTFTDSDFIRKGMFSALVNASRGRAQEAGVGLIYGLPNSQSLPGYVSKLDFAVKGDLVLDRFSLALSSRALAAHARLAGFPLVKEFLGRPNIARVSRAIAWQILSRRSTSQSGSTAVERVFSEEYDELWQRVRQALPNSQVRDASYLRWRYVRNPFSFEVIPIRADGMLQGYFVTLTIRRGGAVPLRHTILMDWLYDPRWPEAGATIVKEAIGRAVAEGSDLLSTLVSRSSPMSLPLGRFGFLHRNEGPPLVIFHQNERGRHALMDSGGWHFTWSDTDGF